jgi:hypothetical protein
MEVAARAFSAHGRIAEYVRNLRRERVGKRMAKSYRRIGRISWHFEETQNVREFTIPTAHPKFSLLNRGLQIGEGSQRGCSARIRWPVQ